MVDEAGPQGAAWPLPAFNFTLDLGDGRPQPFTEVSGLSESPAIEYRHGNSPIFSTTKIPGLGKFGNVTLKGGILARDSIFWDWFGRTKFDGVERRTIFITLMDQNGAPTMRWTLANAWPTNMTGADPRSDSGEIPVESLEFAFETLSTEADSGEAAG